MSRPMPWWLTLAAVCVVSLAIAPLTFLLGGWVAVTLGWQL